MAFWLIAAAMTAGVVLAILAPVLFARSRPAATRGQHDAEVYRAQLAELSSDVERGTLSPAEAETARAEIGRRLLKASGEAGAAGTRGSGTGDRVAIAAVAAMAIALPVFTVVAYGSFGAPGLEDFPLSARAVPTPGRSGDGEIMDLVAKAEARLAENPEDGRGWAVLGPIYLRMGRPEDAAEAFRKAIALLGTSTEREAGLGEALTQGAEGEVTPEARAAFDRALALSPDYLPARFFVALDLSQEEAFTDAAEAWQGLIEASTPNAPWLTIANAALADSRQKAGLPPITVAANGSERPAAGNGARPAAPGPTSADIAAASGMNPGDRRAMIEGMVAQLAEKLRDQPNDAEGWKRLIRSYSVLGETAKASDALGSALAAFSGDPARREEIAGLARSLGIENQGGNP